MDLGVGNKDEISIHNHEQQVKCFLFFFFFGLHPGSLHAVSCPLMCGHPSPLQHWSDDAATTLVPAREKSGDKTVSCGAFRSGNYSNLTQQGRVVVPRCAGASCQNAQAGEPLMQGGGKSDARRQPGANCGASRAHPGPTTCEKKFGQKPSDGPLSPSSSFPFPLQPNPTNHQTTKSHYHIQRSVP